MNLSADKLLRFKRIVYHAWGVNLYQPHPMAPIPDVMLRRMGAM